MFLYVHNAVCSAFRDWMVFCPEHAPPPPPMKKAVEVVTPGNGWGWKGALACILGQRCGAALPLTGSDVDCGALPEGTVVEVEFNDESASGCNFYRGCAVNLLAWAGGDCEVVQ